MKHQGPGGPLFAQPIPRPLGKTFEPEKDGDRLESQYCRVRDLMNDGQWRTLGEIRAATNHPEASISARLRDMRRGGFKVERRRRDGVGGTFEYQAQEEQK